MMITLMMVSMIVFIN